MSWELPPRRFIVQRWLLVTASAVAIAALAGMAFAGRGWPGVGAAGLLPVAAETVSDHDDLASAPTVDPASFEPRPLPPVTRWTRPRAGATLWPDAPHGLTFIATDHLGVWVADVTAGRVQRMRLPQGGVPASAGGLFVADDAIVFDTGATVLQLDTHQRQLQTFATGHRTIDTFDDDALWVFDSTGQASGGTASRVSLDGQVLRQVQLPAAATPLVGTADQLLVTTPGAIARIAADGSHTLIARGEAIASNGTQVAWVRCDGDLSCAVMLGTVDDPDRVQVPLPPADVPIAGQFGRAVAAFSPDGRWLALPLRTTAGTDGAEGPTTAIALIDVITGVEAHRVRGPRASQLAPPLAWSPDSRWLIFGAEFRVGVWRAGTSETSTVDIGFSRARGLALR